MDTRSYKVGGHVFQVKLDAPWKFMEYTSAVAERIARGAAGQEPGVVPIRAGDEVPARTLVRSREELPSDMSRTTLDFSQYEPFHTEETSDPVFTLTVHAATDVDFLTGAQKILSVDEALPFYYVWQKGGDVFYELYPNPDTCVGILQVEEDNSKGHWWPKPGVGSYATLMQVSTALMILYTYNTCKQNTLLLHASVIRHGGMANLFFGTSGTGKSTHSRLWLGNIPDCDLMNDDNPVLRISDGTDGYAPGVAVVYGSPWSGKTPCYRNVSAKIRALVRLKQAPVNEISPISGLVAYASIIASASCIRWCPDLQEAVMKTCEAIAMSVPNWHLNCLPDPDAARTCASAIE